MYGIHVQLADGESFGIWSCFGKFDSEEPARLKSLPISRLQGPDCVVSTIFTFCLFMVQFFSSSSQCVAKKAKNKSSNLEAGTASFLHFSRSASLWGQPLAHQLSRQLGWPSWKLFSFVSKLVQNYFLSQNWSKTPFPPTWDWSWSWLCLRLTCSLASRWDQIARSWTVMEL